MSCLECKKVKANEERDKIRKLAASIAEKDNKTQVIIEIEGKRYIECEECWIKGGQIGTAIEYFIM